jgi:hypothetical protein
MDNKKIVKRFLDAQNRLVLQAADFSLQTITVMVEEKVIDLQPEYQRRDRWPIEAQSALIESFLLNVPVPPVYLAEDDFGVYSAIDGKQRITSVHRFMSNQFPLTGLNAFSDLNGAYFRDLPRELANALTVRPYIRAVTLLKQSHKDLKYEVFTRLNTGGQPLEPQEIRNALYRGSLNDLIYTLSANKFLRSQLKIKTLKENAYCTMQDAELVLRFFMLSKAWKKFSGDFRRSMDDFMREHQNASPTYIKELKATFTNTVKRCEEIWGKNAFKRFAGNAVRDQFLAGMYDAQMIAVLNLSEVDFKKLQRNKPLAQNAIAKLSTDAKFDNAVRVSTNTPSKVEYRISVLIERLISAVNK